jgi:hypothetical protein
MTHRCTVALLFAALGVGAGPLGAQMAGPVVGAVPPACADSLLPRARIDSGEYRSAMRRQVELPPLDSALRGVGPLEVEFVVNARGAVDSVAIRGEIRHDALATLRASLLRHTFWPAVYRGCAVPSRVSVALAFP